MKKLECEKIIGGVMMINEAIWDDVKFLLGTGLFIFLVLYVLFGPKTEGKDYSGYLVGYYLGRICGKMR